jgi:hypothetical protein
MDASGNKSGTTALSPQKTPTFAEASAGRPTFTEAAVGRRSSHALSGALRLARFGACSRLPATNLPSASLIPSGRFKEGGSVIRVSVAKKSV